MHRGDVALIECSVQRVLVQGNAEISFSTIQKGASVQDNVEIRSSSISQGMNVQGCIDSDRGTIRGPISTTGNKAQFSESTIEGITFSKSPSGDDQAVLYLNHTTVNGDINFEGVLGKVICDRRSTLNGAVIGGTVEIH